MIKIINLNPELPGKKSTYKVFINSDLICEFKHDRADGLGKCLITAGKAVDRTRWTNMYKTLEAIGKGDEE